MAGHAFVLHLPRATARRDNARAVLADCGMDGEIWPAVDGHTLSSTDLAACVGAHMLAPAYPFGLSAGEIGRFLSHRQIWAEIVRRDLDFGLIFEGDAALTAAPYANALRLALANIDMLGLIQFQTRPHAGPATLVDTVGASVLSVPQQTGLRSTAQMLSWDAADHLLHLTESFDRPVDTFLQSHWHTGLRPAAIHPSGISDIADTLDGSTIQGGTRGVLAKLHREWARYRYRRGVARASRHSGAPVQGGLA
ncbi:Glycosyltransferase family 25 (LPS biosynthesis protein) [Roseovarius tolerans]|uniref:Glycosyltransferase family 25 (LPS biosynthesis protein) n=1 Tax=Roseovarius tolerans TaxID=74031 RepID=A0A0L6CWY4_9RHOB|nr:glycosyltransferase family 25 protein [Roseovarius tolerans]KNX42292.1 Glycosyltransferase family 25 (LPS biosynthesis protein) [Roseovarius tolerans]